MRFLLLVLVSACGAPFVPVYPGEPECGLPTAVHAVIGTSCSAPDGVACDCEDRRTLWCIDGVWTVKHWVCNGGLGVVTPPSP